MRVGKSVKGWRKNGYEWGRESGELALQNFSFLFRFNFYLNFNDCTSGKFVEWDLVCYSKWIFIKISVCHCSCTMCFCVPNCIWVINKVTHSYPSMGCCVFDGLLSYYAADIVLSFTIIKQYGLNDGLGRFVIIKYCGIAAHTPVQYGLSLWTMTCLGEI